MTPEQILKEADRCVKCGYCLPACPTYRITSDESESPRGRIALVQGLLGGHLEDSPKLQGHLNRCLNCLACQGACPSAVNYGRLMDATRAVQLQKRSGLHKALILRGLNLLTLRKNRHRLIQLLRFYQGSGLQRLIRRTRWLPGQFLKRLDRYTPESVTSSEQPSVFPASIPAIGTVGLFTGCVGSITDQDALQASIKLLNKLGYAVVVPKSQECCGALHRHNGFPAQADQLSQITAEAFNKHSLTAVVYVASACGTEPGIPEQLNHPLMDIMDFLAKHHSDSIRFKASDAKVTIHKPCTQVSTLATETLLNKIPGIEFSHLAENNLCCGAAGTYMLTQADMSDKLLDAKLQHLQSLSPQILLTSNSGCSLHLTAGIREAALDIEVLHPVELIARLFKGI